MTSEYVVLVDENDTEIGREEKLVAHQHGKLHRAFSVFVFYQEKNTVHWLLQKRNKDKYHSGGLWTNTCCSHPKPGEPIIAAGERRLHEEMGMQVTLQHIGEFRYTATFQNGLIENEYDHVLMGQTLLKTVHYNRTEVADIAWMTTDALHHTLEKNPHDFTPWFNAAFNIALKAT